MFHFYNKKKRFIFIIGTEASFENEIDLDDVDLELLDELQFGLLGKLKCKLCKEAMRKVEKEVNRDSAKVN